MEFPHQLTFILPASFNTPAPDGTIFPYPFENSDLVIQTRADMVYEFYEFDGGGETFSSARGQLISSRAEVVPEPAAWILALSASSARKSWANLVVVAVVTMVAPSCGTALRIVRWTTKPRRPLPPAVQLPLRSCVRLRLKQLLRSSGTAVP